MKKQIFAIGGAGLSWLPDKLLLEKYFLKLTGQACPKLCFIPTASGDSDFTIRRFYDAALRLNCIASHLNLFNVPSEDLESIILNQDAIYVGGGNTRNMLVLWREWKLDEIMRKAWEKGIVLGGVSAGSICWFEEGVTDSIPDRLTRLKCLGFLPGSNCPHYDSEALRRPTYQQLILNEEIADGLATEDGVALHFIETKLHKVVSSRPSAAAYAVSKSGNQISESKIDCHFLEE